MPPPWLSPRGGIEEALREAKLSLLGAGCVVLEPGQGSAGAENPPIKAEPRERLGGTFHLGATAEEFHRDLKKMAGRQSPFEFTTPVKGGTT